LLKNNKGGWSSSIRHVVVSEERARKITVRLETPGSGRRPSAKFESPGLSSYGVLNHVFGGHLLSRPVAA